MHQYAIDQYISSPFTREQLDSISAEYAAFNKKAVSAFFLLMAGATLLCVSVYFLLSRLTGANGWLSFVVASVYFVISFVCVAFHHEKAVPKRFHPTKIVIGGGDERVVVDGDLGDANVDPLKLRGSDMAVALYQNIASKGRGVRGFELELMRNLCRF